MSIRFQLVVSVKEPDKIVVAAEPPLCLGSCRFGSVPLAAEFMEQLKSMILQFERESFNMARQNAPLPKSVQGI